MTESLQPEEKIYELSLFFVNLFHGRRRHSTGMPIGGAPEFRPQHPDGKTVKLVFSEPYGSPIIRSAGRPSSKIMGLSWNSSVLGKPD